MSRPESLLRRIAALSAEGGLPTYITICPRGVEPARHCENFRFWIVSVVRYFSERNEARKPRCRGGRRTHSLRLPSPTGALASEVGAKDVQRSHGHPWIIS